MITKDMRIILSFSYIPEKRSLTNNTDHDSSGDVHFHFNYNVNTTGSSLMGTFTLPAYHQMYSLDHVLCSYMSVCVFLIGGLKIRP